MNASEDRDAKQGRAVSLNHSARRFFGMMRNQPDLLDSGEAHVTSRLLEPLLCALWKPVQDEVSVGAPEPCEAVIPTIPILPAWA